jgi:hypothetical protein
MFEITSDSHAKNSGLKPGAIPWIAAGLVGVLFLVSGTASAAVRTVCATDADHTTIQAAVTASGSGDTIIVCPGTYTETVVISGNRDFLSILSTEIAERGPNTILEGGFVIAFAPNDGPDYVTIKGFTIRGGAFDNGVCVSSAGDHATIAFNRAESCLGPFPGGDGGIRLNRGTFNSTVHHNEIICEVGTVGRSSGFGINAEADQALGGGGHTIHHNYVSGCITGVLVSASNNLVGHNDVENGPQLEINISGDSNQVVHNMVCGDIGLAGGVSGNHLVQNRYTGTLNTVEGNRYTKNRQINDCPF